MADLDIVKTLGPEHLIRYAREMGTEDRDEVALILEQLADLAESTGAELARRIADDVQRSEEGRTDYDYERRIAETRLQALNDAAEADNPQAFNRMLSEARHALAVAIHGSSGG